MNEWTIYKHTFPNGKCYIGKTSQLPEDRWGKGWLTLPKAAFTLARNSKIRLE